MNSVPCINNLQSRVGIKPDLEGFHSGKKIRIGEMQIEMSELGCSMEGYYWTISKIDMTKNNIPIYITQLSDLSVISHLN